MAKEIVTPISAQSGIHDAIRVDTDGPPAIVFNSNAGPADLLSYAHGQLVILDEVLRALMSKEEDTALPYALKSILDPATTAIELASNRLVPAAMSA
jgi:hypothetical protein